MFASLAEMQGIVFIGSGKIAFGKLSQALDYGALTLQIQGDFDACLRRMRQMSSQAQLGIYLMNSVNPFRLEGPEEHHVPHPRGAATGSRPTGSSSPAATSATAPPSAKRSWN